MLCQTIKAATRFVCCSSEKSVPCLLQWAGTPSPPTFICSGQHTKRTYNSATHDAHFLLTLFWPAGWVREMYAWDIGVAANKLNIQNQGHPHTPLISQPPHDHHAYNASMYHYTWCACVFAWARFRVEEGSIYKEGGKEVWKFDKRFYTAPVDALKVCMDCICHFPVALPSGDACEELDIAGLNP
eukprot:scaffold98367_cov21-Tisochrysis_lutea.AAC.3